MTGGPHLATACETEGTGRPRGSPLPKGTTRGDGRQLQRAPSAVLEPGLSTWSRPRMEMAGGLLCSAEKLRQQDRCDDQSGNRKTNTDHGHWGSPRQSLSQCGAREDQPTKAERATRCQRGQGQPHTNYSPSTPNSVRRATRSIECRKTVSEWICYYKDMYSHLNVMLSHVAAAQLLGPRLIDD